MPIRLDSQDPDFEQRFQAFLGVKRESAPDVETAVRAIIAAVQAHGDRALIEFTAKFDRLELSPATLRVSAAEIDAATAAMRPRGDPCARNRARPHRRLSRPPEAEG